MVPVPGISVPHPNPWWEVIGVPTGTVRVRCLAHVRNTDLCKKKHVKMI